MSQYIIESIYNDGCSPNMQRSQYLLSYEELLRLLASSRDYLIIYARQMGVQFTINFLFTQVFVDIFLL